MESLLFYDVQWSRCRYLAQELSDFRINTRTVPSTLFSGGSGAAGSAGDKCGDKASSSGGRRFLSQQINCLFSDLIKGGSYGSNWNRKLFDQWNVVVPDNGNIFPKAEI